VLGHSYEPNKKRGAGFSEAEIQYLEQAMGMTQTKYPKRERQQQQQRHHDARQRSKSEVEPGNIVAAFLQEQEEIKREKRRNEEDMKERRRQLLKQSISPPVASPISPGGPYYFLPSFSPPVSPDELQRQDTFRQGNAALAQRPPPPPPPPPSSSVSQHSEDSRRRIPRRGFTPRDREDRSEQLAYAEACLNGRHPAATTCELHHPTPKRDPLTSHSALPPPPRQPLHTPGPSIDTKLLPPQPHARSSMEEIRHLSPRTPKGTLSSPRLKHKRTISGISNLVASADLLDEKRQSVVRNLSHGAEAFTESLRANAERAVKTLSGLKRNNTGDSDESFYCVGERDPVVEPNPLNPFAATQDRQNVIGGLSVPPPSSTAASSTRTSLDPSYRQSTESTMSTTSTQLSRARMLSPGISIPSTPAIKMEGCRLCHQYSPSGDQGLCLFCQKDYKRPDSAINLGPGLQPPARWTARRRNPPRLRIVRSPR
jgi:hypothetical protein